MTIKAKCLASLAWLAGIFLLLTWVLCAANEYEAAMLGAVTGTDGVAPSLERAKQLRSEMEKSDNFQTHVALMNQMTDEQVRYWRVQSAGVVKYQLIERACLLSAIAVLVPLLFMWFPLSGDRWRRFVAGGAPDTKNELLEAMPVDQRLVQPERCRERAFVSGACSLPGVSGGGG